MHRVHRPRPQNPFHPMPRHARLVAFGYHVREACKGPFVRVLREKRGEVWLRHLLVTVAIAEMSLGPKISSVKTAGRRYTRQQRSPRLKRMYPFHHLRKPEVAMQRLRKRHHRSRTK